LKAYYTCAPISHLYPVSFNEELKVTQIIG